MPVPSGLATLSQTAGSNSPPGSDAVFPLLDDYLREMFADFARLRDAAHQLLTGVAGVDTITASNAHIGAYVTGQSFTLPAAGANTGPVTLNINGLGAKAVTKNGTTALVAGDIPANRLMRVEYDGTRFQVTGSIYRDFLSHAVDVYNKDAAGVDRLYFGTGAGTLAKGYGSIPHSLVNGAGSVVANTYSDGRFTVAADAVNASDVPRLGQVQTLDAAVQTAAIAAATSAATTAAQNSALGGPAQSYQDVTASRALSTTYTNSTGRPILVILGLSSTSTGDFSTAVTVAGVVLPGVVAYGTGAGYQTPICFVVPAGATYSVVGSNASLGKWVELR